MAKVKKCNCIAKTNEALVEHGLKLKTEMYINFAKGSTEVDFPRLETVRLDSKKRVPVRGVAMSYCPLCGKKK